MHDGRSVFSAPGGCGRGAAAEPQHARGVASGQPTPHRPVPFAVSWPAWPAPPNRREAGTLEFGSLGPHTMLRGGKGTSSSVRFRVKEQTWRLSDKPGDRLGRPPGAPSQGLADRSTSAFYPKRTRVGWRVGLG